MSTRGTKGVFRVGTLAPDSSGGVDYDNSRAKRRIKVLTFAATSTAETDTTFDIPNNGVVHDVWLKVTTASTAGGTFSVGLLASETGGVATGFLNAVGTSSTGTFVGGPTASTSGSPGNFWSASTLGSFLAKFVTGTTAASDLGIFGPKEFSCSSVVAKSVSFTASSTGTGPSGLIFIEYTEI